MTPRRFLIVDDHPLYLEALQTALASGFPDATVVAAESLEGARNALASARTDLVLMDLRLPDAQGFDGVLDIRRRYPRIPLAVISAMADASMIRQLKSLGVDGFLGKSLTKQEIISAANQLLGGGTCFPALAGAEEEPTAPRPGEEALVRLRELTPQQFKVLTQICEGKLNKQIAFEFGVAETTIKAHITSIFRKLGIHSRTQAVLLIQKMKAEGLEFRDEAFAAGQDRGNAG